MINSKVYKIPLLGGNGEQNFIVHEEWMIEVLKKLTSLSDGAFVDVGINVGQTLLKIKSINPGINYYGFEPNPTCVNYVNRLIEANDLTRVAVFPVAISDTPKLAELNFYYDSETDSAASMVENFRPAERIRKSVYIPCFPAEYVHHFISGHSVSIIKIDVEGAELEVLKGLSGFLIKSRPFILMEILPVYNNSNKDRLNRQIEIESILQDNRYKILRVIKMGESFSTFSLLTEIGIHDRQDWCDYVFCPEESLGSLNIN
ncbi:MAG: FkbM family methyltransferase [Flavitalea sp.]